MTSELLFRALADTTRQRLLRVLSSHELSVSELVEALDQPQSTISRHLKVLRDAELVQDRRVGTATLYAASLAAGEGERTAANGENGSGLAAIRRRLVEWSAHEPIDEATRERLEQVIRRRQSAGHDFFESVGSRWDQLRLEAFGDAFHFEALTMLLPNNWTVADIGAGTGYLLPLLAVRFRSVIAVDPADAMLELARSRPDLESAANVSFRKGSLESLPVREGELDLAIASLVLHHVQDPLQGLRELRRSIRPGGLLLLIEQEEHQNETFRTRMADPTWGFCPQTLCELVKAADFNEIRTARLASARPRGRTGDSPALFAIVATAPIP